MGKNNISTYFVILLLLSGLMSAAQEEQKTFILDPGELYSTYEFSASGKEKVITALGEEKFNEINAACREDQWPLGISSLVARTTEREKITQYNTDVVFVFGDKTILEVKPSSNTHMPAAMQSEKPFFFIIGSSGISSSEPAVEEAAISEEEYYEEFFPQVKIIDPGQIMSHYEFKENEIIEIKEQIGEEGYTFINANCRESSYPAGMKTLTKRLNNRESIMKYNAFLVAESGDFSIVEITPEENTLMPEEMTPITTFYLVIRSNGIEIQDQ